jgi:hypothetical protein
MNRKKTAIAVISTLTVLYGLHKKMQHDTISRFPEIDRKVARKAYMRVMRDAFEQKIPDGASVEEMDALFLEHVRTIDPFAKIN